MASAIVKFFNTTSGHAVIAPDVGSKVVSETVGDISSGKRAAESLWSTEDFSSGR